jgi:hypothetical protein
MTALISIILFGAFLSGNWMVWTMVDHYKAIEEAKWDTLQIEPVAHRAQLIEPTGQKSGLCDTVNGSIARG